MESLSAKINEMKEESMKIINDDPKHKDIVPTTFFWRHIDEKHIGNLNRLRLPSQRAGYTDLLGYHSCLQAIKTNLSKIWELWQMDWMYRKTIISIPLQTI